MYICIYNYVHVGYTYEIIWFHNESVIALVTTLSCHGTLITEINKSGDTNSIDDIVL